MAGRGSARTDLAGGLLRGERGRRSRGEPREFQIIAAVERKFDDSFIVDDLTDGGRLGIDQRRRRGHFDAIGHGAGLQGEIDTRGLTDVELDFSDFGGRESGERHGHFVAPDGQGRNGVQAGIVCGRLTAQAGVEVHHGDLSGYEHRFRLVFDEALNGSRLGGERSGEKESGGNPEA